MNLKEFVELGESKAVSYDFKKEIFESRNIHYSDNEILNLILYKGNYDFYYDDCDRLALTLEIYEKLWESSFNFWDIENHREFVKANGETMNSFNTTYKALYKDKFVYNDKELNEFSIMTHTLGNFIPVYVKKTSKNSWSSPFNGPRYIFTLDYWDITLLDIKKYYDEDLTPSYIKNSERWLESFGSWENFIERNYLQSFLEDDKDTSSNPKEFWKGHFERRKTPPNKTQAYEFLKFVYSAIKKRGNLMYSVLKSKL